MYKVSQIRRSQVRPLPKISFISSPLSNSLNNEVIRRKTTKYDHHTRETRLKRLEIEYIKSQQHWGSIYEHCGLCSLPIGGEGFPKVNQVALFGNRKYVRTRLGYRRKPSEASEISSERLSEDISDFQTRPPD